MKFVIYWKTALLGFRQVANYRTEVWFQIIQRLLVLGGIVLLWSVIGKSYDTGMSFSQLISYFLIANGVRELTDGQYGKFGSKTIDDIKSGAVSSVLLQPTNTVLFLFFKNLGTRGVSIIFSIINIIIGFALIPRVSILIYLFFLISIITATIISYAQSTMVGSVAFWITEGKGIKNVVNHVTRIFSGALIPLTFFPDSYQKFVILNPFASYGFLPATITQSQTVSLSILTQVLFSIFWAGLFLNLSNIMWKRGIKHYEAIGY